MTLFENYARESRDIEQAIARKAMVLGIDWDNEVQVRLLAREALDCHIAAGEPGCAPEDALRIAKLELFGLAHLMLKVMEESASNGMLTHGGPVWKTFGRALWEEHERRKPI
jgi:hypothetical protein